MAADPQRDRASEAPTLGVDLPASNRTFGAAILVEVLAEGLQQLYRSAERVPRRRAWWARLRGGATDARTDLPGSLELWREGHSHVVQFEGPFGVGKSSAMHLLADRLRGASTAGTEPWLVIDFDGPLHQRIQPRWWALLNAVHRSAIRQLWATNRTRACALRLSAAWWSLREGRAAFALPLAGLVGVYVLWKSGAFDRSVTDLGELAQAVTAILAVWATVWGATRALNRRLETASVGAARQLERTESRSALVRRRFASLVHLIGRPVAIRILDLNRCEADFVVDVLDGVNTLLRDIPVVYVIDVEGEYVRESYLEIYSRSPNDRTRADPLMAWRLYDAAVHRIVQLPVRPTPRSLEEFLGNLKEAPGDRDRAEALFKSLESVDDILSGLVRAERDASVGPAALRRAALLRLDTPEVRQQLEHVLMPFVPLLEPNPRQMKTYIRRYVDQLDTAVVDGRHLALQDRLAALLALWTVLRIRWPPLAEFLALHPDALPDAVRLGVKRDRASEHDWHRELEQLVLHEDVSRVILGADTGAGVALDAESVAALVGRS